MKHPAQSSDSSFEKRKQEISILQILIVSLFIGLIAGAGVDKSFILPIAFISAVILTVNRNKIASAAQPEKSLQQHMASLESYHTWPELGQFACIIAAAPFQKAIQQLILENIINPDDNSITKTHVLKAHLVPDNSNPFDSDVVRIDINNRTVCYLNHDEARNFHRRLREKGISNQTTICSAIILWNSGTNKNTVRYTLKLDMKPF